MTETMHWFRPAFRITATLIAGAILLWMLTTMVGCGPNNSDSSANGDKPGLRKIRLALNWYPEAEHGGFYAAQLAGFFEEEGLDVEIIPGGPGVPVIQQVAGGSIQFGVAEADQIPLGRAQDAGVVALMTPLKHSPRCVMVHEESGITRLEDLKGVTLAMNPGRGFSDFMTHHLPLEDVRIVPYSGNVGPFLRDKKFATQAYEFSEPHVAAERGASPVTLPVRDIGYDPYTSLLFTSDRLLTEDRELATAMTRACLKGWQHYLEDPTETNAHLETLNSEMTPEALAFGVEAIRPLCEFGEERYGQMTLDRWKTLCAQLEEVKLLAPGRVKPEECFSADIF
ncbi:MAG: ABC transporter substrate-binding protein [Pirellulaceae bacterium]